MERVSKNFYKGGAITSVDELVKLASDRKSVYSKFWKLKPASVLISMQCRMIHRLIRQGVLFNIIKIE